MYTSPETNNINRFDNTSIISQEQIGIDFLEESNGELQTNDALQIFLNEMDMLMDVEKIDRALHKRITNANIYKTFIETSLKHNSITAEYFQYTIDVKLAQGSRRDIMVIDVVITARFDIAEPFMPIHRRFIV